MHEYIKENARNYFREVSPDERMVLLSTCSKGYNAIRLVVFATIQSVKDIGMPAQAGM
jgi:hypothetical protein